VVRGLLRSPRARAAGDAARAEEALRTAGLDLAGLPTVGRTAVRDLSRAQEIRLSVALALLGRPGRPAVVAVDDADLGLSAAEREEAVALLASLAASGTTVLAAFREAPRAADVVVSTAPHAGGTDRGADAGATRGKRRPALLAGLTRRAATGARGAGSTRGSRGAGDGTADEAEVAPASEAETQAAPDPEADPAPKHRAESKVAAAPKHRAESKVAAEPKHRAEPKDWARSRNRVQPKVAAESEKAAEAAPAGEAEAGTKAAPDPEAGPGAAAEAAERAAAGDVEGAVQAARTPEEDTDAHAPTGRA
jgi:hypothetical protein